jgi:uncharacterized protein YlxW (UPF0749 family)
MPAARQSLVGGAAPRAAPSADDVGLPFGRTGAVLALLAFTLGLFLAAQLQSTPIRLGSGDEAKTETAAITISRLEQEQADLKRSIGEFRSRVAKAQQAQSSQQSALSEIDDALEREKLLAGLVALKGRGVRAVLDDSATTKIPPKDDPSLYIVHEYQIRDVINLLWLSGAEAIALNGERIVASSSVYCVGSTILVNDTRLSPPYEILAIGDPVALDAALGDPKNLRSLRPRVRSYGLQFGVTQPREVGVPAYNGILTVRHATTSGPEGLVGDRVQAAPHRQN